MESCNIAGLSVAVSAYGGLTKSRLVPYLSASDAKPDIEVCVSEAEILREMKLTPEFSFEECEYMLTCRNFYNSLLGFGGILLHSSAVALDGKAYLFSAESGVGKSTHTGIWQRVFGKERTEIINDDKPAIIHRDGSFFACGTPWSGKFDISRNIQVPLCGITFLSRGKENSVRRLSAAEALPLFIEQTLRPIDPRKTVEMLSALDLILKNVPIFSAAVNMDDSAALATYEAMSGVGGKI